jgi:ornithine cyclodeaminase/alanine dehydrogenase-like protein (mu-crystallin family)
LYKSLGIALEDIAFADLIWRRAVERGVGKAMPYGAGTRGTQK